MDNATLRGLTITELERQLPYQSFSRMLPTDTTVGYAPDWKHSWEASKKRISRRTREVIISREGDRG